MTVARGKFGSPAARWGHALLICRVLLAALLIGLGYASAPAISRAPVEYSRSHDCQACGQTHKVLAYERKAIAPAAIASSHEDRRAIFYIVRPTYAYTAQSRFPDVPHHDYDAIGPPTTNISQAV